MPRPEVDSQRGRSGSLQVGRRGKGHTEAVTLEARPLVGPLYTDHHLPWGYNVDIGTRGSGGYLTSLSSMRFAVIPHSSFCTRNSRCTRQSRLSVHRGGHLDSR
jgi:hypothetical protein